MIKRPPICGVIIMLTMVIGGMIGLIISLALGGELVDFGSGVWWGVGVVTGALFGDRFTEQYKYYEHHDNPLISSQIDKSTVDHRRAYQQKRQFETFLNFEIRCESCKSTNTTLTASPYPSMIRLYCRNCRSQRVIRSPTAENIIVRLERVEAPQ